jgi:hypothetical protein
MINSSQLDYSKPLYKYKKFFSIILEGSSLLRFSIGKYLLFIAMLPLTTIHRLQFYREHILEDTMPESNKQYCRENEVKIVSGFIVPEYFQLQPIKRPRMRLSLAKGGWASLHIVITS